MAAVLSTRFQEKAPELFTYQASIIRAEQNFDDGRWVVYGCCYRREALAQKHLNWSIPNPHLYNKAFTGRAKTIPRCSFCLQEDHATRHYLHNPNRSWLSEFSGSNSEKNYRAMRGLPAAETCHLINEGKCTWMATTCHYSHTYMSAMWGPTSQGCLPLSSTMELQSALLPNPLPRPTAMASPTGHPSWTTVTFTPACIY